MEKSLFATLAAGVLACAIAHPGSAAQSATAKETFLYPFVSGSGGAYPNTGLIDVKDKLYGVTVIGGASNNGTAFSIDLKTGAETVLHSFAGGADGVNPISALVNVNGTLYGTTNGVFQGIVSTVFALNPKTGKETIVYTFCSQPNCTDGDGPTGNLIAVNGILYGTTALGGSGKDGGTVFSLNPKTGQETVLYSFCTQKNCTDGQDPSSGVIDVGGTLYGETYDGGAGNGGFGTVFSLDLGSGQENVLYTFCSLNNCADGGPPSGGLIGVKGTLYGTTISGGNGLPSCFDEGRGGCGTVFSVDSTTGAEKVVYSFCTQPNCADGEAPYDSLIDIKGKLYGTTSGDPKTVNGTVFSLDPTTGQETTLYSFCNELVCKRGRNPQSSLLNVKGTLYGTTYDGGTDGCKYKGSKYRGCGTVFGITP